MVLAITRERRFQLPRRWGFESSQSTWRGSQQLIIVSSLNVETHITPPSLPPPAPPSPAPGEGRDFAFYSHEAGPKTTQVALVLDIARVHLVALETILRAPRDRRRTAPVPLMTSEEASSVSQMVRWFVSCRLTAILPFRSPFLLGLPMASLPLPLADAAALALRLGAILHRRLILQVDSCFCVLRRVWQMFQLCVLNNQSSRSARASSRFLRSKRSKTRARS